MNKNKKPKINIPVVICTVAIIASIAAIYIALLDKTVTTNINGTISELAEHDESSIQKYIDEMWSELEYIENKFQNSGCETIEDIETLMNVESSNCCFTHIYMVADDGKIYTDKLLVYDPNSEGMNGRINLLPYFDDGSDRVVARFDDKDLSVGIANENIIYGIRLDNFTVDGVTMTGLVGICDLTEIQDKLVIDSFSDGERSRGYSAVIDADGNYIVNEERTVYLNKVNNFYERVECAEKSQYTADEIDQKMSKGESFSFSVTNSEGVEKIVYCKPFSDDEISWYFLLSVEKSVFDEQNYTFFAMSMIMAGCIAVVIAIMLIYVLGSEKKVIAANAEAKARSQFLANMSHEIRTPLNGIIGLIYLVEHDIEFPERQGKIKKRLTKMENTAEYLLSLINNILDISKLQSGKVELNRAAISPEIIADAVWSMQKSTTESRGIDFMLDKNVQYPWIYGDEILIKRVLINIVGNAVKFTPQGGKILLSVSQHKSHDNVVTTVFSCADTGCGMSEEFLTHIWDMFTQEQGQNTNSQGTGLGMAISKLLAEAMGGDITVESKPGEGSTFNLILHSEISKKPPRLTQFNYDSAQFSGRSMKVLLAEDNELNAEILIEILEHEGFEVAYAQNGKVAAELFAESAVGEFDIILMDMQMPEMDGCTATKLIRSMDRSDAENVPIFACTANTFKEDRNRALDSGMNDFLSKPIDINELLMKIGGGRDINREIL